MVDDRIQAPAQKTCTGGGAGVGEVEYPGRHVLCELRLAAVRRARTRPSPANAALCAAPPGPSVVGAMEPVPLVALLALAVGLGASPVVSPAQRTPSPSARAEEVERDAAVRAARREQARFERIRRNHLPWAWGGGGGECDERIGRFCLTHGDPQDDWNPPPEAEAVVLARERLLERLDLAAAAAPADGWVAGQRVRYLLEGKRWREAGAAGRACRADLWWCLALEGFASHAAGEAGPAQVAFDSMLSSMPVDERRSWTDPSILLDTCARREYRRAGSEGRAGFDARFWRLADPFASRDGNEIRSEHFSRHVWDRLQDRAASTEGMGWGDDLRQIVLRFGWPTGWERIRGRPGVDGPPQMVSHYPSPGRDLLPPCESLAREGRGEWDRENPRARASYSLPLGDSTTRWVHGIDHQLALFRRGDSAVLLAAYRLPPDSFPPGLPTEAALAILPGRGSVPPLVTPFPTGGHTGRVAAPAPTGPILASVEIVAAEAGRAARVRHETELAALEPGQMALSDILLLEGDSLPESVEAAAEAARTSTRVAPGERVGVFWEIYGLPRERAEALAFSVSIAESRAGWLTRLGRRIGLTRAPTPVRVRWSERSGATGALSRALALQIPPDLRPGEYTLELTASLPGRESLTVRRAVRVQPAH